MIKKNYYLVVFIVFFIALFALSVGNQKEIEESESNLNENLEIELPREITDPDEIIIETPPPKPSWAGSMTNITIDETGTYPGSYTWAQAKNEDWCDYRNGRYYIENATIDASTSPTGCGIFINYSINTYFTIKNCTITGASSVGIYLKNTNNGTIISNNCSNNNDGVSIRGSVTPFHRSANNTIANNTLSWNNQGFACWSADSNIIDNNILNNNDNYGIANSGRANMNNFTNNIIRDDSSVSPRVGIGLNFYNADSSNIINNTIINCQSYGIKLSWSSTSNTVKNNTIINALDRGIIIYDNSDNNILENNTIIDCGTYGIDLFDSLGTTINTEIKNNTIINAGDAGIRLMWDVATTIITDNKMINCSIFLDPATNGHSLTNLRSHTTASNNSVNGNPVYCYVDKVGLGDSDFTNLGDIGQIILINCNDSDISDFTIPNPIPITLWYSNNNTINNNTLDLGGYGYAGIILGNSSLNNITANIVRSSSNYGILITESSDNNNIRGNLVNDHVNPIDDQCINNNFVWNVLNGDY